MRRLRLVGIVFSLLIAGVLGGLLAPIQSDAGTPTLTLKLDTGPTASMVITTSSTCTSAELNLGYTACYAINTNTVVTGTGGRQYRVQNAPGATARLRVGDKVGQDKFSLIGVQFVPVVTNWGTPAANTNEQHVLTITMVNTFDSAVNVNNSGTYVWALRAGGEFRAGPSQTTSPTACAGLTPTGRCDTIGDKVAYPGKGTFNPSGLVNILRPTGANSQPLSFTVGGPAVPIVSFNGLTNTTLGQVNPTYPSFSCDADGATGGVVCKPFITQTMTVTLKGPDSFVLVNGGDMFGANCAAELSDKQERQIDILEKLVKFLNWLERQRPNPRLSEFIDKIEAFLATINSNPDPDCPGATLVNLDIAIAAANDQVAFMADGAVPAEPAPPHFYAVISRPGVTWETAKLEAEGLGEGWHLATITSGAEQAIINSLLPDPTSFTGTKQYWIGGEQQNEAEEPGGNWQWINGEGIFWNNEPIYGTYQNWGNEINGPGVGLQPDNVGPQQNHLSLDNRYGWGWDDNDQFLDGIILGYVAEGPSPLLPVIP